MEHRANALACQAAGRSPWSRAYAMRWLPHPGQSVPVTVFQRQRGIQIVSDGSKCRYTKQRTTSMVIDATEINMPRVRSVILNSGLADAPLYGDASLHAESPRRLCLAAHRNDVESNDKEGQYRTCHDRPKQPVARQSESFKCRLIHAAKYEES